LPTAATAEVVVENLDIHGEGAFSQQAPQRSLLVAAGLGRDVPKPLDSRAIRAPSLRKPQPADDRQLEGRRIEIQSEHRA